MAITYDEVTRFFESNEEKWRQLAIAIELAIVKARDTEGVPVYLTKMRIKRPANAYLKTKRKTKESLYGITDWIGIRVLCLFRQDIASVHRFLLKLFFESQESFGETFINEIFVFNWEAPQADREIKDAICNYLKQSDIVFESDNVSERECHFIYAHKGGSNQLTYKTIKRGSGYKSVHYTVRMGNITVEVQLRTLLQDVWGELEHALSYKKGKIHPHIKNSFELLSRELEAKDMLVSGLRDESEKEKAFSLYGSIKSGPNKWLEYESSFVDALPKDAEFIGFLRKYFSNFSPDTNNRRTRDSAWCERMSALLITGREIAKPLWTQQVECFFDMEEAFVAFCSGNITDAEEIYERYVKDDHFQSRWVVHFRLGEIHNVRGDIEKALVCFDRCESLLEQVNVKDQDLVAECFAKQKLANVYWSLGEDYTEIACQKIEEAEKLFKQLKNNERVEHIDEMSLLNCLCYYALEKYLKYLPSGSIEIRFRAKTEADRRFQDLETFLGKNPGKNVTSNVYDTLAWYAFHQYKITKDGAASTPNMRQKWLRKAFSFVEAAEGKPNVTASAPLSSVVLQHEHVQEIMAAYNSEIHATSR